MGTGAMGSHVCGKLVARGDWVACTTRYERIQKANTEYVVGDAHDPEFLGGLLVQHWDAIVDFMV